jgi:hypothetical protein
MNWYMMTRLRQICWTNIFVLFHLLMILIMFPQIYHQELMHYYLIYILLRNCSRACLIILCTLLRWDLYLCISVDDFFVLAILFNRFRVRISLLIWEQYKYVDLLKLNNAISEFQWESYLKECTDIDIMSSSFTQKYLEIIHWNSDIALLSFKRSTYLYCQTVRIYVFLIEYGIWILISVALYDKPWFNSHIKREIRTRNRLNKIARTKKSSTAIHKYKSHRNKVNNM